jgi:hypothetical protein
MLDNDDNMPEWTQKKITKAADYVDTAADYISSQKERGIMSESLDHAYEVHGNRHGYYVWRKSPISQVLNIGITDPQLTGLTGWPVNQGILNYVERSMQPVSFNSLSSGIKQLILKKLPLQSTNKQNVAEQALNEGIMDKIKGIVPKFMQMVGADAAANIANRVKQVTGGDYSLTQANAVNVAKAFGFDRMLGKQVRENAESDQYGLAGNWQGKLLQLIHAGTIGGGIAHLATAGSTSGGGLGTAGIILTVIGGILLLFTETFWSKNRGQVGAMGRYGNQGVETSKGPETKLG